MIEHVSFLTRAIVYKIDNTRVTCGHVLYYETVLLSTSPIWHLSYCTVHKIDYRRDTFWHLLNWPRWHSPYCTTRYFTRVDVDTRRVDVSYSVQGHTVHIFYIHVSRLKHVVLYFFLLYTCPGWHITYCTFLLRTCAEWHMPYCTKFGYTRVSVGTCHIAVRNYSIHVSDSECVIPYNFLWYTCHIRSRFILCTFSIYTCRLRHVTKSTSFYCTGVYVSTCRSVMFS